MEQEKSIKKILKEFIHILIKYSLIVLLLLIIIVDIKLNILHYDVNYGVIDSAFAVIQIFTIIPSIIVSLSKDEIQGVKICDLHKMRLDLYINLLDVFIISFLLISLIALINIFNLSFSSIFILIFSLIYAIIISKQTTNLIYKNENFIKKLIKNNNPDKKKFIGNNRDKKKVKNNNRDKKKINKNNPEDGKVTINETIKEKKVKAKDKLNKTNKKKKKSKCLNDIGQFQQTSVYNIFVTNYIVDYGFDHYCNIFYNKNNLKSNYSLINTCLNINLSLVTDSLNYKFNDDEKLVTIITKTFNNIQMLLNLEDKLDNFIEKKEINNDNFVSIVNNYYNYRSLEILINELKHLCENNNKLALFNDNLKLIIQQTTSTLGKNDKLMLKNHITYKVLTDFINNDIKYDRLFFLENIRESMFYQEMLIGIDTSFFFFYSLLIYYYMNLDSRVPNKFKDKLKCFWLASENDEGLRHVPLTNIFNFQIKALDEKKTTKLLEDMIKIFDVTIGGDFICFYRDEVHSSYDWNDGSFDKSLIIDFWVGLLFTYHYTFAYDDVYERIISNAINKLSQENRNYFINSFKENWLNIEDKKIKEQSKSIISSFTDYNINKLIDDNKNLCNILINKVNKLQIDQLDNKVTTDDDLLKSKEYITEQFSLATNKIDILDQSLDLDKEPMRYFSFRLYSDMLLLEKSETIANEDFYVETFYYSILNKLIDKLKSIDLVIKSIDINNLESLKQLFEKYNIFYSTNYVFNENINKELTEYLNSFEEKSLSASLYWYFAKDAIKYNIQCVEEQTQVRRLYPNEIASYIDTKYKPIDGLYKYSQFGNSSSTVYLTREELTERIKNDVFACFVVFKEKLVVDTDKILKYKKIN